MEVSSFVFLGALCYGTMAFTDVATSRRSLWGTSTAIQPLSCLDAVLIHFTVRITSWILASEIQRVRLITHLKFCGSWRIQYAKLQHRDTYILNSSITPYSSMGTSEYTKQKLMGWHEDILLVSKIENSFSLPRLISICLHSVSTSLKQSRIPKSGWTKIQQSKVPTLLKRSRKSRVS